MGGIGVGFRQEPTFQLAVVDAKLLRQLSLALLHGQPLKIRGARELLQPVLETGTLDKGQAEVKLLAGGKQGEGLLERGPFLDLIGTRLDGNQFGVATQPEPHRPGAGFPLPQFGNQARRMGAFFDGKEARRPLVGERLHLLPFVIHITPGDGNGQGCPREQGVEPIKLQ
ncbi:hypothetical protein D3C86_726520 [compost metagenome]